MNFYCSPFQWELNFDSIDGWLIKKRAREEKINILKWCIYRKLDYITLVCNNHENRLLEMRHSFRISWDKIWKNYLAPLLQICVLVINLKITFHTIMVLFFRKIIMKSSFYFFWEAINDEKPINWKSKQ